MVGIHCSGSELLSTNKIFIERSADVGVLPGDVAINYGVTGPTLRGSGISLSMGSADSGIRMVWLLCQFSLFGNTDSWLGL